MSMSLQKVPVEAGLPAIIASKLAPTIENDAGARHGNQP